MATHLLILLCLAGTASRQGPRATYVCAVAPDVLAVTIEARRVEHARQVPYRQQPGDEVESPDQRHRWVRRNGEIIGSLAGADGRLLYGFDRVVGPKLRAEPLEDTSGFLVSSEDDSVYAGGRRPLAVHRKSRPTDLARTEPWQFDAPRRHRLFLRLPTDLSPGAAYRVQFPGAQLEALQYAHEPRRTRSVAVHVSHLGFRPDDPAKVAFLSCWMGTGGPLRYEKDLRFDVLEEPTGRAVHSGQVRLSRALDEPEDAYERNYSGTDVYEMDFSALRKPGSYRVHVQNIGCSYPFRIGRDVWRRAFRVSARGFYHQRSGIPLGPPHTEFERPRPFHPADGVAVYHSTCPLMNSGNGLNALGTDEDNFGNLVKGETDKLVPHAWGGYMDAGDWDRRIQHLVVTHRLLELYELFPAYFQGADLNIPESANDLPDVVDEALFNLDCYRRMQTPDGGIRGGIESAEHPRRGEASWQESLPVMAYAPGTWSSYVYAGAAARAARVLRGLKPGLAGTYAGSALRAIEWAEGHYEPEQDLPHQVRDARNLAALELWRLTGEERWHEVFEETTIYTDPDAQMFVWRKHQQREAAWSYARASREGVDRGIQANARAALLREADSRVESVGRAGFRWAKYEWRPPVAAFSSPDGVSLVRAHVLTGDDRYLRAAVLACQTGAGANPLNLSYTTGTGYRSPRHPLHIDSRITNRPPPPGLTVFGPTDPRRKPDYFGLQLTAPHCTPQIQQWPALECYFDVFLNPRTCEFTVQNPMARNAYVWGYLAARGKKAQTGGDKPTPAEPSGSR